MFFFIAVTTKEKALDFHQTMICPDCGAYGSIRVWVRYQVLLLFFVPIFRWNRTYYGQMHCCRSVYQLDEKVGQAIEKGVPTEIHAEDLKQARPGQRICQYCGYRSPADFQYCPKCGKPL